MELLEKFRPAFLLRHLHFKSKIPPAGWVAQGDIALIRIILNNLLDNAISHVSKGGEIRITGDSQSNQLVVCIANPVDSLPENLDRLFEPLFRNDSAHNDAGAHLGIGLILSLGAATAMGATLQARKPQEGWIEFSLIIQAHPLSE